MLSAHNSRWAEYSFTLWPFMLRWQCQRHAVAASATGGPLTISDCSKVVWVRLGIQPIFLAILSTFQERADRGVAPAGKFNYLWFQLHWKCRGWIWVFFFFFFFLTWGKPRGFLLGWSPWDLDCNYTAWNSPHPDFSASAETEFSSVRNSHFCCTGRYVWLTPVLSWALDEEQQRQ